MDLDTTLKGAIVSGETAIKDVGTNPLTGGNLTLISEQESANFTSKNSSFNLGASLSPNNDVGGTISLGSKRRACKICQRVCTP